MVLQAAQVANEHWSKNLSTKERSRFRELVGKSRGLPGNLTERERQELKKLVSRLDVPGAGRKLLPLAATRGRKR